MKNHFPPPSLRPSEGGLAGGERAVSSNTPQVRFATRGEWLKSLRDSDINGALTEKCRSFHCWNLGLARSEKHHGMGNLGMGSVFGLVSL